jgi:Transposase, Mutator family
MLKAIHASEDIVAAREKAIRVIEKLRGLHLTRAAKLVEAAVEKTLTYYAFPEEHWRSIRTNNLLERILREIRRRTRVVGASALNLAAARLRLHSRHLVVDEEIFEHRAAEGPADERHHRLSQCWAPLSPNQMCERLTLPVGDLPSRCRLGSIAPLDSFSMSELVIISLWKKNRKHRSMARVSDIDGPAAPIYVV